MVIFGKGYVGSYLSNYFNCIGTQRQNRNNEHYFALEEKTSWIYHGNTAVVTFDPSQVSESLWEEFLIYLNSSFARTILLSPSSRYSQTIQLGAPLVSNDRVSKEVLWQKAGGELVVLVGIYGPSRCPIAWLKKGLIARTKKQVNLIHLYDIAFSIEGLLKSPKIAESIFWDGQEHFWADIESLGIKFGLLAKNFSRKEQRTKRIFKNIYVDPNENLMNNRSFQTFSDHLLREYSL